MPSTQDILSQIAQNESGGNPTAQSSTSSASGLYGFLTGTWQQYAPQAGVSVSQYPTAASAPASVQTQVASITPLSNWTCQGCDANFSQYAGQNGLLSVLTPSDYGGGSSVFSDGSYLSPDASVMLTDPGLAGVTTGVDPTQFYVPGTDTPLANQSGVSQFQFDPSSLYTNTPEAGAVQQGLGGSSASGTDWWATFWNVIGNLLQRAGLGLLGIILIAAAAWAASRGDFGRGAQHAIRSV